MALIYAKILQSRKIERELEKLKLTAETATEKLAISPVRTTTAKLSRIPAQYEESLKLAHENTQQLIKRFTKIVNVNEI